MHMYDNHNGQCETNILTDGAIDYTTDALY